MMNTFTDISYGSCPEQKLDIYLPHNDNFDVFIFFHGGGLEFGTKDDASFFSEELTKNNIAVISVDYRMYPTAKYPEFVLDCAKAVSWVFENIKTYGNPKKFFIGGSSAGAQLSTLGIEGQTYKIGEDGMAEYLGFEEGQVLSSSDLSQKYGLIVNGMYRTTDKRSISYKFSEREQEAQDWYKNCGGFEPMDPVMSFDDKTSNDVVKYITALSKEFETVMFNYIVGSNTGDKAWNEWLNTAKKLGEDQLIKIYNDRYNKFYK